MSEAEPKARRKLPIGIQTFRVIREEGHYYADKTPHIERLIEQGTHYFLSRPRRFGKSLLLDTIKELFEGSEELFRGLHIQDRWDWKRRHPVVRLDFGGDNFTVDGAVETCAADLLDAQASGHGVSLDARGQGGRFAQLLRTLHQVAGERVVVLIDEYDKPILDALGEPETARANRDFLRGLYGVIKSCDAHIRFTLLTGVSKFSKVNLFSGLNNLEDITLDRRFATICGYTEGDLDTVFAPELEGLDRQQVREWYNGYNWRGDERVYNPFDILLLFRHREYRAWWFETGTPTFLIDTLVRHGVNAFALDGLIADDGLLSSFEVDEIGPEALLFQTGYLTVEEAVNHGGRLRYRLGYPNLEVRQSLNEALLKRLAGAGGGPAARDRLHDSLIGHDLAAIEAEFRAVFAGIPADWHRRNDIAHFEGYYASVFYACLAALGFDLRVEDASAAGRVDLALRCGGRVYLFEFKVIERAGEGAALRQLKERGYAEKYRSGSEPVHLIGIEFSEETRNIANFETATS
ncbi:MAG: ATP-binding protein [Gammaproteobacteria bacterium]|nr:ATP-binding protein [Gammaproteobacteria bacterium]MDE0507342.1 ATP-binding protein [Gammaproteobacteria bacterium]MXX06554.1 ATP-binding protein [Gammaproteobacteria bacterium]MXY91777.1 ATP-binding protein [Gammaproteobacteria bacterium]MYE30404.1 ATP-binding protein [Gammaproteobacteria bacterium]